MGRWMILRGHWAGSLAIIWAIHATQTIAAQPATNGTQLVPLDMNRLYAALDYDIDARIDAKTHRLIQTFLNLKIPVVPLPKGNVDNRYDSSLGVIYWNASAAVQVANDSGAGTGKYISPALLLLDSIAHAVAHAQSPSAYASIASNPDALFGTLEQRRVIAGLSQSAAADANKIFATSDGNGLENAVASAIGEPVRTNATLVLQNGNVVEGVTYMTVDSPTWHKN